MVGDEYWNKSAYFAVIIGFVVLFIIMPIAILLLFGIPIELLWAFIKMPIIFLYNLLF